MKNYYRILGVLPSSSEEEIKQAYRKLVKRWHPDVNKSPQATEKLKEINEAYDALMNHKVENNDMLYKSPIFNGHLWNSFNFKDIFDFSFVELNFEPSVSELKINFEGHINEIEIAKIIDMFVSKGCKVSGYSIVKKG